MKKEGFFLRSDPSSIGKAEYWLLAGLLVFGFALRLYRLGEPSFWLDEVFQARAALVPTFHDALAATPPNKPPLFYILEWIIARFTISEWALRFPSCLAGVAAIWAVWRLARTLFSDATVALLAAGLIAVSPFNIAYSQEARGYAAAMLFSVLGVAAMLRETNHPAGRGWKGLAPVALWPALSCWILYFGIGVLALQLIWAVGFLLIVRCFKKRAWPPDLSARLLRVVYGLLFAVVLLLPLYFRVPARNLESKSFSANDLTMDFFLDLFGWFSAGTEVWVIWSLTVAFAAAALIGLVVSLRKNPSGAAFLLFWFVVLQAAQIFFYVHQRHWISARYHLLFLPPYLVWTSLGFVTMLRLVRLKPVAIGIVLIVSVFALGIKGAGLAWLKSGSKQNMKKVVLDLSKQARPGDVTLNSGNPAHTVYNFYRDVHSPQAPPSLDLNLPLPKLISHIQNTDRIWVVAARMRNAIWATAQYKLAPSLPRPYLHDPIILAVPVRGAVEALAAVEGKSYDWKRMQARLPLNLEMSADRSRRYLSQGWSASKKIEGRKVRRMEGSEGSLHFRLSKGKPSTVTLVVKGLRNERDSEIPHEGQEISVHWDKTELGTKRIETHDFTTWTLSIPPEANARGSLHSLRLHWGSGQQEDLEKTPPIEDDQAYSLMLHRVSLQ